MCAGKYNKDGWTMVFKAKSIREAEELLKVSNKRLSIENTYSKSGDFSNIGYICDDFEYIFNKIVI